MIGKYIWQKEICENDAIWVYVRCDTCGHEKRYLEVDLLYMHRHRNFTYAQCDRCKALVLLKKEIHCINYASNEVFLK